MRFNGMDLAVFKFVPYMGCNQFNNSQIRTTMSLRTSIHPPVRMGKDKKEINLPTVDHGVDIIGDEWEIDMVVSVNVKKKENDEDKED